MSTTRTETDSFGPIEVRTDAYWGAQTERSIENFPFGPREQMPLELVHALGFIKQAAARVNARLGLLDPEIAEAIQQTSDEVLRVEEGALYPALHRLELRGLLKAEWGVSGNNRRAKFYRLTAAGRRRLAEDMSNWQRLSLAVTQVLESA